MAPRFRRPSPPTPLIDDPDLIFPGQVLQLPNGTGPSAGTYTVRSGDSMRKIAAHFDLTLGELTPPIPTSATPT